MKKNILITLIISMFFTANLSKSAVVDTTRLYGVTIDAVDKLANTVTALSNLYKKPTTRIVFDEWVAASTYINAVNKIHNVSFIMGEILDSYYMKQYNL